ncbi:MAG: hypothetical protein KDD32_03510 [Bacteroidetes bacterium]|nr:hypothetical protein [Bacteroidota bacterium]
MFLIFGFQTALVAQNDRHYNTIQYGLRGMILNGAMVAGVDDNSAIYYNPAALSTSDNKGLDISLFAVSMAILKEKNLFNVKTSGRQSDLSFIPGLITYNATPFKNKKISLSAASITRYNYQNIKTQQKTFETEEGIHLNMIDSENNGREFWLAGAVAYGFENNVSIGLSQYLSFRGENYTHDLSYRLFDHEEVGKLIFEDRETLNFKQNHSVGLITKLGLSWHHNSFKIGATITTPMYARVFKSASVFYSRNQFESGNLNAETYSFKSKGKFKTPMALRVGIEVSGNKYLIAASTEYFTKINTYQLITTSEKDLNPLINGTDGFVLEDSRRQIFNFNLGWEITLNDRFRYLGGLRTNFNFNNSPSDYFDPRIHYSYFDVYHVTQGLQVNIDRNNFTIGIDYGFSFNDNLPALADLSASSFASAPISNASVAYNNLTFLFTYNFILERVNDLLKNEGLGI